MYTLKTIHDWHDALYHSDSTPVLIFKHSNSCGTSGRAKMYVQEAVDELSINEESYMVTVQTQRDISNTIEEAMHVKHESPQVIIVYKREPFYFISHSDIQTDELISKYGEVKSLSLGQ